MIFLIDKPRGMSSALAVAIIKRQKGAKKAGHAGTLDPRASGLLIIATNEDTKKLTEYLKLDKTYEAVIRLGEQRTTGDLEGDVVMSSPVPDIEKEVLKKGLMDREGIHPLPVPVYSAIKKKGKPLYHYARKGKDVEVPVKEMRVERALYQNTTRADEFLHVAVVFEVGSGTYIRSLAEDFGRRLGCPATLASLRRTSIGKWRVEDAEEITQ